VRECVGERVSGWSEWVREWVREWVNEWVGENVCVHVWVSA